MEKLFLIPRAIADIFIVWKEKAPIAYKCSITYTFIILKIKKWIFTNRAIIRYPILGYSFLGINNESLQFLIKEIFIFRVYNNIKEVFKDYNKPYIVDVGSNIGLSILFFKSLFPNCKIESYEPEISAFDLLRKNIMCNRLEQIELNQTAVGSNNGFIYADSNDVSASINQKFTPSGNPLKAVKCVRLADIISNKCIDCIKLDIEGAELDVLKDVINAGLLKNVFCWLIEFHDSNEQVSWIKEQFINSGFLLLQSQEVCCYSQFRN